MMQGDMMDGMMQGGMMGGTMLLWGILSLALFIGLIVLVVLTILWLLRRLRTTDTGPTNHPQSPLEILQRRLAQGEITSDQFQTLKRQLQLETESVQFQPVEEASR